MASGSLQGPKFFCENERAASLKCAGDAGNDSKALEACQNYFDTYKECKKKAIEERNSKNRGGAAKTFL
jgi:hypothetical protein